MTVAYYILSTRDGETAGTPDAIRWAVRLYLGEGNRGFFITGPFEFPPATMPARQRRAPVLDLRLCANCFHQYRLHRFGTADRVPRDVSTCPDCNGCAASTTRTGDTT